MRFNSRTLILSALAALSFSASVTAQETVSSGNWSDASTWSGGAVLEAGGNVTIASGETVRLDVSPPALNRITILGKLAFADEADLDLTTEWIMVHGELEVGTEAVPFSHNATITLTDNVKDEQLMGMGDRGIMLSGGTLNLHGNRTHAWTRLTET